MTLATLTTEQRQQLLNELGDQMANTTYTCAATGYRGLVEVMNAWGFDVDGWQAKAAYTTLCNEFNPSTPDQYRAAAKTSKSKAAKAAKSVQVGDVVTIYSRRDAKLHHTGVVVYKFGKGVDVRDEQGNVHSGYLLVP